MGVYDNIKEERCIFKFFVNSKTMKVVLVDYIDYSLVRRDEKYLF